jgi:cytochrome c biogenesis protein CcdA/thiol-disulfide isomerase/thioredoxin
MLLLILVFLGGVLTILSPCILPVLPFVFARSEQRFLTSGLPLLAGMAATFAGIATLAAVGGAWAVRLNQYGRVFALLLLTAFAATLLSRHLADALARPFVALGNRLVPQSGGAAANTGLLSSLLLGIATGLLWAPCAGPILGLVLTGAAISGPNAHTTLLLLAYAAGAATSLALAILAGGRVFAALKRSLGAGEWVRRGLGVAVLIGVVCIAFGWDTSLLARLSLTQTSRLEQSLLDHVRPGPAARAPAAAQAMAGVQTERGELPIEGPMPSLQGASAWLNSPPLTTDALRGKVVLVDFWTYSCINCLRTLPYVKAWWEKYKDHGLVIIGVHTPEFAFEKDPANVRRAVQELGISYPVALDGDYTIWRAFNNQYWPADYFVDAEGRIRYEYFSEGDYDRSEQVIRGLLQSAGHTDLPPAGAQPIGAQGALAAADMAQEQSPETYVGYRRAENFAARGGFERDTAHAYALPSWLDLNHWGLQGVWTVGPQSAVLDQAGGQIQYRFAARDLHLVLGMGPGGKPVRFRVQLDGADPGANHGVDTDANGYGVITEQRLYQLIRQSGTVGEHVFSIQFLDDGAQAYAFTFG